MLDAEAYALGPIQHANTIPSRRFVPMMAGRHDPITQGVGESLCIIRRALVNMAIVGANQPIGLTALGGGVSSDIYRADLPHGVVCVKRALARLKVAADWRVPVERNEYEVEWLRVARAVVPQAVPEVVGWDRPSGTFAMTWLAPDAYPVWKSLLMEGRSDAGTAGAVGDVFGRIHAATADRADIAARFATDELFYAIRLHPYLVTAAEAHPGVARALHDLVRVTAGTRRVLVHGDASPKNILVGPQGPVIVDAECAWYGDPAFDVAFLLNHLVLKSALHPQRRAAHRAMCDALVDGYRAHVRWEPWDALEARVATLLPGLMLARVDGKSPVEYLDDPRREIVRTFARGRLSRPTGSLSTVLDAYTP